MKKIKVNNKLNLNKEVVSKINDAEMENVVGGLKIVGAILSGCRCITTTINTGVTFGIICVDTVTDRTATIRSKSVCEI